jgi:hypothetical protein
MATRAEKKRKYKIDHRQEINEKQKIYYQKNKEIIKEKKQLQREAMTEEEKQAVKDKSKASWEKYKDKHQEKVACNICGVEVTKRQMSRHKQSLQCQSHIPDADKSNNNICCDRCGKWVPKIYWSKHKETVDCMWFPATQLNIPMKVAINMVHDLPSTMPFEERLQRVCDQYKDGYIEPPKEKKQWQIEREIFDKAIRDKEVLDSDGQVKPQFQKYLL